MTMMTRTKRCCGFSHQDSGSEAMVTESLAMEHHRLHVIEQWPDGPEKRARLEAVRSAIAALDRLESRDAGEWACIVCGCRGFGAGALRAAA